MQKVWLKISFFTQVPDSKQRIIHSYSIGQGRSYYVYGQHMMGMLDHGWTMEVENLISTSMFIGLHCALSDVCLTIITSSCGPMVKVLVFLRPCIYRMFPSGVCPCESVTRSDNGGRNSTTSQHTTIPPLID